MTNKARVVFSVLILILIGVSFVITKNKPKHPVNFDECLAQGNMVGESYPRQCWTKSGEHFVEKVPDQMDESVTLKGEITCLPKVGDGPQTMECAIGLLAEDGRYYSLANLSQIDTDLEYTGGQKVVVTGTIYADTKTGPDGNRYNTVGDIVLFSITNQKQ